MLDKLQEIETASKGKIKVVPIDPSNNKELRIPRRRREDRYGRRAAMLLRKGEADGLICGTISTYDLHLHYLDQVLGRRAGTTVYGAMTGLVLPGRQVFIVDTHVNLEPTAAELAELTLSAADQLLVRRDRT